MKVNPEKLEFEAKKGVVKANQQEVTVTELGGGGFSARVKDGAAWLTLSQVSGKDGQPFAVNAQGTTLRAGNYSDAVVVEGPGGEVCDVPVSLVVRN